MNACAHGRRQPPQPTADLMEEWLFEPAPLFVLSLSLLNLVVPAYLLRVRQKSVATRWLAGTRTGLSPLPFYAFLTSSR